MQTVRNVHSSLELKPAEHKLNSKTFAETAKLANQIAMDTVGKTNGNIGKTIAKMSKTDNKLVASATILEKQMLKLAKHLQTCKN